MKPIYVLSVIILLLFCDNNKSYAVPGVPTGGEIVYDPTNAANMAAQIEQLIQTVENTKAMADNIGNGKITPETINFVAKWYNTCGGSRFSLPNWFPSLSIKICGSQVAIFNSVAEDYKAKYIPLASDDETTRRKKEVAYIDAGRKVKVFALTRSAITLRTTEENQKALASLQNSLNTATTQTEVLKIQAQATVQLVQQMQELNQQLATLTQVEGFK